MKSYKLFQFAYLFNLICCLFSAAIIFYRTSSSSHYNNIRYNILVFIFMVIYIIYDWFCFLILNILKNSSPISRKIKIIGTIMNIIGLLLTAFILFKIFPMFKLMIEYHFFSFPILQQVISASLFGIILTFFYLSISYWLLLKNHNLKFINILEKFGNEE